MPLRVIEGDEQFDEMGEVVERFATCGNCGATWNDAIISSRTPAPSSRCPFENDHEERAELATLQALADKASGYAPDWEYGEALIRDTYFQEYAEQLAEDIGAINSDATWPNNFIDWEAATEALQQDYTQVEFDGVDYWIR